MFVFIVSNSEPLIHLWLVSSDLRRICTVHQLIPLEQIYLADALEWFHFCSNSALRRNRTLHKTFLHTLTKWFPFGARSDRTWAENSNGDSPWESPFAFTGTAELLLLGFLLDFPCGRLGTNSFWRPFGSLLLFAIPGDFFSGIPPCFPLLGFTLIVLFARNSVSPVGGLLFFSFFGELHFSLFKTDSIVMKTLEATAQLGGFNQLPPMRKPNKHLPYNRHHQHENDAIKKFFSSVKSHDGTTDVELMVGIKTLLTDVYAIWSKSGLNIAKVLQDCFHKRGIPINIWSNNVKEELTGSVHKLLRAHGLGIKQYEAHKQNQNPAERRIK